MYLIEKYEYIYFVKPVLSSAILPSLWYFLLITCVISTKAGVEMGFLRFRSLTN